MDPLITLLILIVGCVFWQILPFIATILKWSHEHVVGNKLLKPSEWDIIGKKHEFLGYCRLIQHADQGHALVSTNIFGTTIELVCEDKAKELLLNWSAGDYQKVFGTLERI